MQVHPRVKRRHPDISDADVEHAWENSIAIAVRVPGEHEVRIGFDLNGRAIEMAGVLKDDGEWLVYHAFTPPTRKFLTEIGM